MLSPGQTAPDFILPGPQGRDVSLADLLRDGPVLLYFYPADFTPVCTKQACMVRDVFEDLRSAGIRVIGISAQNAESHDRFRSRHEVPFDLLSDPGRKVAKQYQAVALGGLLPRRVTYLIDSDGRILDAAEASFSLDAHRALIDRALKRYAK